MQFSYKKLVIFIVYKHYRVENMSYLLKSLLTLLTTGYQGLWTLLLQHLQRLIGVVGSGDRHCGLEGSASR